jgi:hypothetical protein
MRIRLAPLLLLFACGGSPAGAQTNAWRADRGTVTITSARDEWYTMQLAGVHLIPENDPFGVNRASGELQVDGTVFSVLP